MISCLLVEDQTLVRLGLANLLNLDDNIEITAQAENGQQAIQRLETQQFDVMLLDMRMPVMNGLEVLKAMQAMDNTPSVLIITTFEDCDVLVQAINLGAKGYVLKDVELETLIAAINKVACGKCVLQDAITHYLLAQHAAPHTQLTNKEHQVLTCLSLGMSNKAIAKELSNSEGTIRNQVSQILAKLDVNDRTQAVIKAMNLKLI